MFFCFFKRINQFHTLVLFPHSCYRAVKVQIRFYEEACAIFKTSPWSPNLLVQKERHAEEFSQTVAALTPPER